MIMSTTSRLACLTALLVVISRLSTPVTAGVATYEIKHGQQLGEQALLNNDLKNNETLDFAAAAASDVELVVEEFVLDDMEEEDYYDDEEEEEEDEEYYNDYDEEDISEAYSTSVSSPAVAAADIYGSDLGHPQVIDAHRGEEVKARILDARTYIRDTVKVDPEYKVVRDICVNKHENCAFWAGTYSSWFVTIKTASDSGRLTLSSCL